MHVAIATAAALTVVEPTGNSLSSDALAILWDGQDLHGLNASGRSPAGWTPERFNGLASMPLDGWESVAVPGAVSGWVALWERFGCLRRPDLIPSQVIPKFGLSGANFLAPHDRMQPSIAAWPILLSSSGLKKIIVAFNDIECRLFKANTFRAISAIACSTLLNQSRLKLYHYTSRPRLRLGRGSDFYTRVGANDCTKHHRKQRRAQCVESSDHCRLASACVTFVQDVA